jgi:hypothetical protein
MIGDEGLYILAKGLRSNLTITVLNLSANGITHIGVSYLCEALERNESITEVNLASDLKFKNLNKIGVQGAALLSKLL